jgi:hypothetical protein
MLQTTPCIFFCAQFFHVFLKSMVFGFKPILRILKNVVQKTALYGF